MNTTEVRKAIVAYLRRELIGPAPGFPAIQLNKEEILRSQDPPRLRYSAGILFPRHLDITSQSDAEEKEIQEIEAAPPDDSPGSTVIKSDSDLVDSGNPIDQQPETDVDVNLTNQYLPSAMGLSALVEVPKRLTVKINCAQYQKCDLPGFGKPRSKPEVQTNTWGWLRRPFAHEVILEQPELVKSGVVTVEKPLEIEGGAKLSLHVVSRPQPENQKVRLVTFTLINRNEFTSRSNDALCFFQCGFEITDEAGSNCFLEYPDRKSSDDREARQLRFLYRKKKMFAVGHGCACGWELHEKGGCNRVWTDCLPTFELSPIVHRELPNLTLSMRDLAHVDDSINLCEQLAVAYETWIAEQRARIKDPLDVPPGFTDLAEANLRNCDECLARMRRGIVLLRSDTRLRTAFRLANEAMYLQQAHYDLVTNSRRDWELKEGALSLTTKYREPDYESKAASWRPFQLAFLLMNLESIGQPDSDERSVVDLIWFPTGGGKTEAYLGLSAIAIFYRRLSARTDSGTSILMRYTLRLLTTQQFQRAASLICSCEYIRRRRQDELGTDKISIGLWVGGSVTPNDHQEAVAALNRLYQYPNENKFIVLACPWCGAAMGPVKAGNAWRIKGYIKVGRPSRVVYRCEDPDCPFSTEQGLPLAVVDEEIYDNPPTLVIGTVDKFAMLPWRPEARSLFGIVSGNSPPDLIIQDELHLISGPLGSMVAHYETAIEALCRASSDRRGPKIVSSTATISRASDQIAALYDGRKAFLFPPQALEVGNSFFAREDTSVPGRCYLGVFASALPSHVTAQIRVVSALLQSVKSVSTNDPALLDPFWTLMIYFNSIRELGHAATLIRADIREYMNAMWDRQGLTKDVSSEAPKERRFINRDLELTSRIQSNRIPEILAELFNSFKSPQDFSAVDVCLATNMIQVGLDVPRLSLMTIVGQPKTTAEYIQASSRVGRKHPGLVVTIYNPARPRDRSHYEHFRSYHESIYRYVEPTSITPFARPVIERALHAVIIALIRMLGGTALSERPSPPPDEEMLARIRSIISKRVTNVDADEVSAALERMTEILGQWRRVPPSKYGGFSPPDAEEPLMFPSGTERNPRWSIRPLATPSSMRNVDSTCDTAVLSSYPEPE